MSEAWMAPKALAAKLVQILEAVGTVEKKGYNKAQNYNFVRETDLVDKIRPAMAKLGVYLHQSVIEHRLEPLYETRAGGTMYLTTVQVSFTWVDGATGETWPVPGVFPGTGADTGDKGVYKALTGAEKYFLMKTFLIGTGDDPEGDEKVDQHAAAAAASRERPTIRRGAQEGVQRGGRSDLATDAQRDEFKALAKDLGSKNAEDLRGLVQRLITGLGAEAPEWDDTAAFVEWMRSMSSAQMGKLIVAARGLSASAGQSLDLS